MDSNEFKKYAAAWKNGNALQQSFKYTVEEIEQFKSKSAKDFISDLNRSILFDMILKGLLVIGILLLTGLFQKYNLFTILLAVLGVGTSIMIANEFKIRKNLRKPEYFTAQINETLSKSIDFFHTKFPKLLIMIACSYALLVWVGSLFYAYIAYGKYKTQTTTDVFVTFLMITIAFSVSYFAHSFQYKEQIQTIEENLAMIDDIQENSHKIEKQLKRRRLLKFLMFLALALGVIVFAFLILLHYNI